MSAVAIFAPRRFARLLKSDVMNVVRDPVLIFATVMSLAPALALSVARHPLDAAAFSAFGVADMSRYIVAVALLLPATLIGWVTGFLLLEDRDEGALLAVDTTPVGKAGFLLYRTGITAVLGVLVTLYAWPLVLPEISVPEVVLLAVLVALNAVGFAVSLPAIARNKVEGLALTKLTNLLAIAPLLAAIPSPWRFLAGVLPPFWLGEALQLTDVVEVPFALVAIAGLVVTGLAVMGLFALFSRRIG